MRPLQSLTRSLPNLASVNVLSILHVQVINVALVDVDATIDRPDNQPSCIEEKKALEKARARLARAEQKAEAVRRWTPVVLQQFRETCVRLVHFQEVVDVDAPRAVARVEQMLRALDAYREVASPRPSGGSGTAGQVQSVARLADEQPPREPVAAAPADPPADPPTGGGG